MIIEKILAIVLSLGILGQGWIVSRHLGTWISPAGIFSLIWFVFTFFPLLILAEVPISFVGMLYIFIACVAFSSGTFLVPLKKLSQSTIEKRKKFSDSFARLYPVSIILSIAAVILMAYNIQQSGGTLGLSLATILETSGQMIQRRYDGISAEGIATQVALLSMYSSCNLAGIALPPARGARLKFRILILSAMAPPIFLLIFEGNKGALPLAAVLIWSGVLVRKLLSGNMKLFEFGSFRRMLAMAIVALPLFVISFLARGLSDETDMEIIIKILRKYFGSYSSGHLYAFSDWLDWYVGFQSNQAYEEQELSFGFYTFMSVFRLFGDNRFVPPGIYTEYFMYDDILQTNIYTIYRGLVLDFGLIGSIIFLMIMGFCIHLSYRILMKADRPVISVAIFLYFSGFAYSSFIVSQLVWNSPQAAAALVGFLLWLNAALVVGKFRRIEQSKGRK